MQNILAYLILIHDKILIGFIRCNKMPFDVINYIILYFINFDVNYAEV